MYIWKTVSTLGDKYIFAFSAGLETDYEGVENITSEDLKCIDEGLGDALWEAMNGENPDEAILSLLKDTTTYNELLLMPEEEQKQYITQFVRNTFVSTVVSIEIDGADLTPLYGDSRGQWDFIFEYIIDGVLYLIHEELLTQK